MAMTAHNGCEYPEGIITQAREFYMFLTGNDPVLDRTIELTEGEESNVIPFDKHIK
jgi:hypothetical protein